MLKIDESNKTGILTGLVAAIYTGINYMSGIEWDFSAIDPDRAMTWIGGIFAIVWYQNKSNRNAPVPGQNVSVARPAAPVDNGFQLSPRSLANLTGVNDDLAKVTKRALRLSEFDFVVTSGVRTKEQQKVLLDAGKSRTMNSRHLSGHAVDVAALVNNTVSWDHEFYKRIAEAFKRAGDDLGIPIEWGGDWPNFVDATHFQLPRAAYA